MLGPVNYHPSDRFSPANQRWDGNGTLYEGRIKLRLAHLAGRSVVVPDLIFVKKEGVWSFFRPSFFGPNFFLDTGEGMKGGLSVDICHPQGSGAIRLSVDFETGDLLKTYPDGAQLYKCTFWGPSELINFQGGRCDFDECSEAWLELNHFTSERNLSLIRNCNYVLGSSWNILGNRRWHEITFVYFTCLPSIQTEADLRRIAMSCSGHVPFQTTPLQGNPEVVRIRVYRENTRNRTEVLTIRIPSFALPPHPIRFHRPQNDFAYYEVVFPEIFRVGLNPNKKLKFERGKAKLRASEIWQTNQIVVGDAATGAGLKAPMEEDDSDQVFLLQDLRPSEDVMEFWFSNGNTDLFSNLPRTPFAFE